MVVTSSSTYSTPYIDGNTVTLTCTVTGDHPTATIQWRRNGFLQFSSGNTLSISNSFQSGDYTCTAINAAATAGVTSNTETVTITSE